ncbi:hypothetical protein UFOVP1382_195 [uncultured Caudovirales phage]|uniref:Uncharacterized protein n=1 Tax=uncultured Caudovirales phage TaxID=2100421 RepID=A0A6J5S5E2_9CAUD|nr:hypothetical protein UFOVP1382_195 [uncultured Caudovirales phage]
MDDIFRTDRNTAKREVRDTVPKLRAALRSSVPDPWTPHPRPDGIREIHLDMVRLSSIKADDVFRFAMPSDPDHPLGWWRAVEDGYDNDGGGSVNAVRLWPEDGE